MLTGSEKAWAAFVIGVVVQSLDVVLSYLPQTPELQTIRLTLLIIVGVVGTIGVGLGVYQVPNTPTPAKPSAPVSAPIGSPVGDPAPVPAPAPSAPVQAPLPMGFGPAPARPDEPLDGVPIAV